MPTRKTTAQPALKLAIQTALRPLERLARYLNGEDPLVTTEAFLIDAYKGQQRSPSASVLHLIAAAKPLADRNAANELGAFVQLVQSQPYPSGSPKTARLLEEWVGRGRRGLVGDALWAETLADFVGNPYRDRLHCCANPTCQRWFVDYTRNGSRERCTAVCTMKVANANRNNPKRRRNARTQRRTTRRGGR